MKVLLFTSPSLLTVTYPIKTHLFDTVSWNYSYHAESYANGCKGKTVATRLGKITFDIPQVREENFYPQSLEKEQRNERALKLALAEMYIQGISTRRVKAITEQLCGFEVFSTQVSQATALLDEQLRA